MNYFLNTAKHRFSAFYRFIRVWAGVLACIALAAVCSPAQVVLPQNGVIGTLAGNGTSGYSGDNGPATGAQLSSPGGVAVDSSGNIYIADTGNSVIRLVSASTGVMTTVAGTGTTGYSGDNGAATGAQLNSPAGVALDGAGNLYIVDSGNSVIRMVSASTGVITTVAGNGTEGYSGDGGLATAAELNQPAAIAIGSDSSMYVVDSFNGVIRKVAASSGIITTIAGNGTWGYSGDGGAATSASLFYPDAIALDLSNNLYIADYFDHTIRKVTTATGIITTVAGNATDGYSGDGGQATNAQLDYPQGVAVDSLGNIYIAHSQAGYIREVIASSGIITTIAGNGNATYTGDGGPATQAGLFYPALIAVTSSPTSVFNVYVADLGNNAIRAFSSFQTAAPIFSPVSATYSTAQTVTISDYFSDATIHYTTDGTTPTSSSTVYSGPITVSSSETLKAMAITTNGFPTAVATAAYTITQTAPTIDFSAGFTTNGLSLVQSAIVNGALQLSDGNLNEQRAAWYTTPVSSHAFTSDFNYQALTAQADGITFTLQNDPSGTSAIGLDGQDLGYAGIQSSVAIKFDMWNNLGEGIDSTGYYTDGVEPILSALDMTPYAVILRSGDILHVHVTYDGTTLTWTISDTVTNASFTDSTAINIPSIVGGDTAYVGITGSTGGFTSTQYVTGWTLISGPATTSAAPPTFSLPSGTYGAPQNVTISDSTTGAVIYYTTDGSTPSTSSNVYSGAITVGATETLNAIAVASGYSNSSDSAAAYTISSGVTVSVSPSSATLYGGQTQQLSATVSNSSNTAVTWSISPAGVGLISTSGLYTAPASITTQQTVTVTATSQADATKSGSATITLSPQCSSNGYNYQRAIVIDHTKIPNTDQINFPFFFNSTDTSFATVANGGHVTNSAGYDIIFSSDQGGQSKLDFELESYNPTTGQVIVWVRIPTLSHTTDTVIYVSYGNSAITTSQQNAASVWDSDFEAVYHLAMPGTGTVTDSTANGNSATQSSVTAAPGKLDQAASFNGSSSFIQLPAQDFPSYPTNGENPTTNYSASFGAWFKTATSGVILGQAGADTEPGGNPPGWGPALYVDTAGQLRASMFWHGTGVSQQIVTPALYNDNKWHFAVDTYSNGTETLYVDGQNVGTQSQVPESPNDSPYTYFLGTGYTNIWDATNDSWFYFGGAIEEARISDIARSSDWVSTEFSNQSSPSTFSTLYSESAEVVVPNATSLYASQTQQFTAIAECTSGFAWSLPSGAPGTITASGLYTAPASIVSAQTISITATSQASGMVIGSALVTLAAPPTPISLAPASQPPYGTGSSQGFIAALKNPDGTPASGVTVNFTVTGANSNIGTVTSDSSGLASYAYIGSNSGNDIVQAAATVDGQQVASNVVSATWVAPPSGTSVGVIQLNAGVNLGLTGLCGAFTDSNGSVIEPVAIGASTRVFTVPPGATQLQLGVVDDRYGDNNGAGFVVAVNGVLVTVLPTTMPWTWVQGGLNSSYRYGIQDGTNPVVALRGLSAGQAVSIVYESGTVSAGTPFWPYVNAAGDLQDIVGAAAGSTGTYEPTLFLTASSYPTGQPFPVTAIVSNGSGEPLPNTEVILSVTGANSRQFEATTDSSGTATFTYVGVRSGTDTLEARAFPTGEASLLSGQAAVTWTTSTNLPPAGSLSLTPGSVQPLQADGEQTFTVLATDASGSPLANTAVGLEVSGVDNLDYVSTTNTAGIATFNYQDENPGVASVVATAFINGSLVYSNQVSVPWTLPESPSSTNNGSGNSIVIGISALSYVNLPNSLQLNGSVTDSNIPSGATLAISWTKLSGSGTVTFSSPTQAITTASFSEPGEYVLELSANDSATSGSLQFPVTVNPASGTSQGWIGTPINNTAVSGIVPIIVASGESLQSGTLSYYPAAGNASSAVVLNANTTGSGQIGTLDTTQLANGSYWIQLQATDTSGNSSYNLVFVTVTGNYKPGRVTASVTDLVVPATGLAINIQRNYDSLNAATVGDFGYGWNLGTTVNLAVDNQGNVTFTLGGQRKTFYLTPRPIGFPFAEIVPIYTAEPGFNGSLTNSAPGCPNLLDFLIQDGSVWFCAGGGVYTPPGYIYTDPSGTQYTISANGSLQSVVDRVGNALTITPAGITSSTGLSVPFVRDSQGRITQITDTLGNQYLYTYDTNGNLATVTYPNTTQPSTYTYAANHYYTGGTDFRSNPLPVTAYYGPTDTDPNGLPLNGRLQSVTDSLNETTSYAYNLLTNTTTVTYPQDASGSVGTATMVYDSYGMLLSSTDPLGHTTTNVYDPNHNLISVTDPLGHTTTSTYDSLGNKASSTYPATATSTNTTSYTVYNQYSEPTSTTDELGNVRAFNYDANYNPQSVTDSAGTLASFIFNANQTLSAGAIGYDITAQPAQASQFTYDANGNLASRTDALGRTASFTYNALGQKLTSTEPPQTSGTSLAAATTTYSYDALGNLTQTAAPLSRTTSSTYDANNNKISDTDPRGNITTYQYDTLNRLTTTTYPTSPATTMTMTYDFRNNVIDKTDQAGHVTHNTYDLAGRLASVTQAYGTSDAATATYEYDNAGRKTSEVDPLGHTTTYAYDAAGNLVTTAGVKGTFAYSYDNARNQISMTDANGNTTRLQYDARKRQTKATFADGTTKTNAYDGPGNLASVTDQSGNVVQYTYDAANQLSTVVQAASPNTGHNTNTYGYDPGGNLTGIADENNHITMTTFDQLYQMTGKTLPDGALTETRSYDAAGNLISLTHFNGKTTTYAYDALNRLITRTPDPSLNEAAVSFSYTATGKRASMADASGTTNYSYDAMDRLTTKATPEGSLYYGYDAAGNLASMSSSNANGVSVNYTYDDLNRLSTVIDGRLGSGLNTTTYTYDPANNLATATLPNGLQSAMSYDALNRVTTLVSQVSGYGYQYGPTGTRTSATELSGRTLTWNYDGIYRLTNETVASDPANVNGSVSYSLDPVGNRLSDTSSLHNVSSGTFGFNSDDELASETYDANGNTLATGGKTFAYDAENRMTSMNGGAVTIVYDGDGNRVSKTVGGVTTQYLVDDLNPTGYAQVVEEVVSGAVTRQYAYGLQRINERQIIGSTWTPSFYGYDGGGNVTQLTNVAGTVTDTSEYDAFGNLVNFTGTTPNVYLYRGEEIDSDLGLYYLRARYYNPITGRFMSRDPLDGIPSSPKTLHKYLYAGGDPINLADPSGRATTTWTSTGGAEYGVIVLAVTYVAVKSAPLIAQAASCILDTAGSLLQGVTTDLGSPVRSITFFPDSCSVKVKRGCSPEEVRNCVLLYSVCQSGRKCGDCLNYCTTQCEWPFHRCPFLHDIGPSPIKVPPGRIQ